MDVGGETGDAVLGSRSKEAAGKCHRGVRAPLPSAHTKILSVAISAFDEEEHGPTVGERWIEK